MGRAEFFSSTADEVVRKLQPLAVACFLTNLFCVRQWFWRRCGVTSCLKTLGYLIAMGMTLFAANALAQNSPKFPVEPWSSWELIDGGGQHGVVVERRERDYNRPFGTEIEYRLSNANPYAVKVIFANRNRRCGDGRSVGFLSNEAVAVDKLGSGERVSRGGGSPDCNGSGGVVYDTLSVRVRELKD